MREPAFDNTYARLPEVFFAPAQPTAAPAPSLIRLNEPLAEALGLDAAWLRSDEGIAMLSGGAVPEGAEPIAMAYAGHQFGGWSPQLGDGRALLLGEVVGVDGVRHDIHLKGSGRTAFSRGGDGKAGLGPVMREYIVSEAMAALGVPTTRALAAITTGESIVRDPEQPGAVFARVARSHVRVGTFQYFYARDRSDDVRTLADYVIDRHYPGAREHDNPYRSFLEQVIARQAALVAKWMSLGFIHGVMNTDNAQIAGETIDYGPCAFMDAFHPKKVFSSIDRDGRYAWGNQPGIADWNLTRLAETLVSLFDEDQAASVAWAESALGRFRGIFLGHFARRFRAKLGLSDAAEETDLVSATLAVLAKNEVDFTLFFRHLTRAASGHDGGELRSLFERPEDCDAWLVRWRQELSADPAAVDARLVAMRQHNPILIPRNHRIEEAIRAGEGGDYAPFHRLVDALADPFGERDEYADLELAPAPHEVVHRTFCGT